MAHDSENPLAAMAAQTDAIFKDFTIHSTPYVTRDGHDIMAHVLIPPGPAPAHGHPVLLNFHGGYLVSASALFAPFFPLFALDLAKRHSAIIISADYTLLPHADGLAAVHADLAAFHTWLHESFPTFLASQAPGTVANLSQILANGGSAGGYVATAYALAFPAQVQALAIQYPMIDFSTAWWRRGTQALGLPNPLQLPDAMFPGDEQLRETIAAALAGPRVSATGEERMGLGAGLARAGLFHDVFSPAGKLDGDDSVWLERRVARGDALPARIWVLHGDADTAVPVETSVKFAETMQKQNRPVRLDVVPGKEHGWDGSVDDTWKGTQDPVVLSGTAWLAEEWLRVPAHL